ncbi:uncharacterized protein N7496_008828 [Penicillium cataractarum]|uniref:Ig-like domain-containing protein n=1 Tax=Penicillium cataractarum TaxID=2100454 RepID=A0A9W9V4X0_9EURO|nr:uncharacterized protein N7496_008828 [Penicillium cataractarum]KAJ5369068.1 hypothetical protein N7496_008828 [Penicillium cataractarum]
MRTSTILTLAAALTAHLTTSLTIPGNSTDIYRITESGIARRDMPAAEKTGYLIFSNGCFASGSGFPQCRDLYTFKWGKENDYNSCYDDPAPFQSACKMSTDSRDVKTPLGTAKWEAYDNCEKRALKGTLMGDDFIYFCWDHDHSFTENCGFTWSSHAILKCDMIYQKP